MPPPAWWGGADPSFFLTMLVKMLVLFFPTFYLTNRRIIRVSQELGLGLGLGFSYLTLNPPLELHVLGLCVPGRDLHAWKQHADSVSFRFGPAFVNRCI